MTTMKVALYSGIKQIGLQEVERQAPPPGYVVVAMRQIGICGSDLHAYYGEWTQTPGRAQGHETCGIIVEVGEEVTGFAIGDHVVIECFYHCGKCVYCKTGYYNLCVERQGVYDIMHGGFSEFTTVHQSALFKLPPEMSYEQGALVEPLAVGVRALALAHATHQDRVVIIGGGTIGLLCLAVAKANGVREAMITVKYPQQARVARDLGADQVIDVTKVDVKDFIDSRTKGMGVDAVVETTAGGQSFDDALAIVRKRGTVVLVGGYHKPLAVDLSRIVAKEPVVTGSMCYGYSGMETDFQQAIDLITGGRVDPTKIVTHRFPFAEISQAFVVAGEKESGSVKVHLVNAG